MQFRFLFLNAFFMLKDSIPQQPGDFILVDTPLKGLPFYQAYEIVNLLILIVRVDGISVALKTCFKCLSL